MTVSSSEISKLAIPDDDNVTRLVYFPHMYDNRLKAALNALSVFMFSKDEKGRRVECLVWCRDFSDADLHLLGHEHAKRKQEEHPGRPFRYDGFISTGAGTIRTIDFQGYGFYLEHEPEEGANHIIVGFRTPSDEDIDAHKQHKLLKTQLKQLLFNSFSPLVPAP